MSVKRSRTRPRDKRTRRALVALRSAEAVIGSPRLQFKWASTISELEWAIYCRAIEALRSAGIPFLLGGGFALAAFIGRWRDTKDIDFYIRPADRDASIAALSQAGFEDYYSRLAYDRKWIYRNVRSNMIVDIIWSMANQRAQVDEAWFSRAGSVTIRSQQLQVIPPEEFMWCKLYILQRDHCDWTDIFNLLYVHGPRIDWEHLIRRLEDDTAVLKATLTLYGWLCPRSARKLPEALWRRLKLAPPDAAQPRPKHDRIRLLDSRRWFAALLPRGGKLEV